jgi:glyoxylase-like metal-dependent hydrolase (beta-lactamase superfamily II)
MLRITPRLALLTQIRISNVWLLEDSGGRRMLVDCGHPLSRPLLQMELWRAGIRAAGDLHAVLVTHRHSDHAGNAAWLRRRFGCAVVAHPEDARILRGECPAPRLARGRARLYEELLCQIEDRFPARSEVDDVFEEGRWMWGLTVVPVPGHTEGSVLLYHEPTETLFSGDAILAGHSFARGFESLRLAVPGFSLEVDVCHGHVRRFLRELPAVQTLASGHGPPVRAEARSKLQRLG